MGKETNYFSDTGKVIFYIGNRKPSESEAKGLHGTILERHKEICKMNDSWASNEFKSRNINRRNKMTAAAVVRWNLSKRKMRAISDRGGHSKCEQRQERRQKLLPGSKESWYICDICNINDIYVMESCIARNKCKGKGKKKGIWRQQQGTKSS